MSVKLGLRWTAFWRNSKHLRTGWLIAAGLVAFYVGAIRTHEQTRGIAQQRATGLASPDRALLDTNGFWHEMRLGSAARTEGIIGGVPGGDHAMQAMISSAAKMSMAPSPPSPTISNFSADRKMVRTSSMDLVVRKPAEAAEKIRALAENMGGFLLTSEMSGGQDETGSLTVRVPAARFEEAREEIRKLGLRVESEKIEAQDVTRQYVDQEANLRNLRAEEAQYLTILKQAHTVKDTLEVSEKLSGVRGQIEQQQAEFDALSKQIETVAITVSLRAEAEAQVFGLRWRPLYQMKLALRDGLDAVAGYAAAMTAMVFYLPAVLLWLVTIVVGAAVGWKLLRWTGRVFFAWPKQTVAQNG